MGGVVFTGTDRFEVVRRLGEGAMGVVYEALDRRLNTRVALKTLKATDPDLLLRFKTEFRALQDLEHANLVTLGELIAEHGQWFFTMELVDGVDVRSYVRRAAPAAGSDTLLTPAEFARSDTAEGVAGTRSLGYDETRLRDALAQLTDGIAALHMAGKIHRDIKPSNILVAPCGRAVLLDFGLIAELDRERANHSTSVVGTPNYMSPEQSIGRAAAPASDWYSVGVILYELLCGRLPFDGSPLAVLTAKQAEDPLPPRDVDRRVPNDLNRLCMALLARSPSERPDPDAIARTLRRDQSQGVRGDSRSASRSFTHAFVGRDAELARLVDAVDTVQAGEPIAIVVAGTSGIGKSQLVRRFLTRVAADIPDAVVLAGRCYERETLAFKAFDGVIDELSRMLLRLPRPDAAAFVPRNAAYLAQVFPVLRRVEAIGRAPRSRGNLMAHELRNRAFTALRQLLCAIAELRPLLLFVDDFQWADPDSIVLLNEIMHRPHPPPLGLILTVRSEGIDVVDKLELGCELRSVDLDRLSADEATDLATRLGKLAGVTNPETIEEIARESGGHPLFIHELVRHVESTGGRGDGAIRLDDALWQRIERLDEPARRVLSTLAVAGAPIAQQAAALACEMEFTEYSRWAAQLRIGTLARTSGARGEDRVETYHDRVREAIVNKLDSAAMQRFHERIGHALEASGAAEHDPEQLVLHLDAAGEHERAAEQAVAAAIIAQSKLAFDRAAELYRTALRLGGYDDADERDLRIRYAAALVDAGRGREAADEYLAVAASADKTTALDCTKNAAMQLLLCGHIDLGMNTLREVLASEGLSLPKTPRGALARVIGRRAVLRARGLGWKPRHERELSPAELTRLDVYQAVSMSLGTVDHVRGADFQSRFTLAALRAGEPARVVTALAMEAAYLGTQGGPRTEKRARQVLAVAQAAAEQLGDKWSLAICAASSGAIEHLSGHLAAAKDALAGAEQMLLESHQGSWELHTVRTFTLWNLKHKGESREMRRLLDVYLREAIRLGNRYAETTLVRTSASAWLQLDNYDEAVRALERTSWEPPAGGYHLQHWYLLKSRCLAEVYARTGELTRDVVGDEFAALSRSLLGRLQIVRVDSGWTRGRLALVDAERGIDAERALAQVDELVRWSVRQNVAFGPVWGLLLRAGAARLRGRDDEAATALRGAIDVADEVPMRTYAAAARRVLARLVGGSEGERLRQHSDEVLEAEGIVDPARYTGLICPGFGRD